MFKEKLMITNARYTINTVNVTLNVNIHYSLLWLGFDSNLALSIKGESLKHNIEVNENTRLVRSRKLKIRIMTRKKY